MKTLHKSCQDTSQELNRASKSEEKTRLTQKINDLIEKIKKATPIMNEEVATFLSRFNQDFKYIMEQFREERKRFLLGVCFSFSLADGIRLSKSSPGNVKMHS